VKRIVIIKGVDIYSIRHKLGAPVVIEEKIHEVREGRKRRRNRADEAVGRCREGMERKIHES
jgi:hypothetical protein